MGGENKGWIRANIMGVAQLASATALPILSTFSLSGSHVKCLL